MKKYSFEIWLSFILLLCLSTVAIEEKLKEPKKEVVEKYYPITWNVLRVAPWNEEGNAEELLNKYK